MPWGKRQKEVGFTRWLSGFPYSLPSVLIKQAFFECVAGELGVVSQTELVKNVAAMGGDRFWADLKLIGDSH